MTEKTEAGGEGGNLKKKFEWPVFYLGIGALAVSILILLGAVSLTVTFLIPEWVDGGTTGPHSAWMPSGHDIGNGSAGSMTFTTHEDKARVVFFVAPSEYSPSGDYSFEITVYDFDTGAIVAYQKFENAQFGNLEFPTGYNEDGNPVRFVVDWEGEGLRYHVIEVQAFAPEYYYGGP